MSPKKFEITAGENKKGVANPIQPGVSPSFTFYPIQMASVTDALHNAADHACALHEALTQAHEQLMSGPYSLEALEAEEARIDADFVECTEEAFRKLMRTWYCEQKERIYPTVETVERFREMATWTVTQQKERQKAAARRLREHALAAYEAMKVEYATVMHAPAAFVRHLEMLEGT